MRSCSHGAASSSGRFLTERRRFRMAHPRDTSSGRRKDVAVFGTGIGRRGDPGGSSPRGRRSAGAAAAAAKTVAVGVSAAAAIVTFTACGPVQMGAAAIIGTERVPASTLSGDVSALNKVYQAHPSLQANVQYKPSQMPQLVL